jgi:8-oxo-dGTP pyrophosphatase MutT (NUDIX family)
MTAIVFVKIWERSALDKEPQPEKTGVSQKAVILDDDGNILVLLRGAAPTDPFKWDLPGGGLEFGEDPYESIRREVREETGLEVEDLTPFDIEAHVDDLSGRCPWR